MVVGAGGEVGVLEETLEEADRPAAISITPPSGVSAVGRTTTKINVPSCPVSASAVIVTRQAMLRRSA